MFNYLAHIFKHRYKKQMQGEPCILVINHSFKYGEEIS